MSMTLASPGIYIQEIPSTPQGIVGASTSATAFLDYFPRGPVNLATLVQSWNAFQRLFGGIDPRSEASYGVYQFFLNGGGSAWIIRLVDPASVAAVPVVALSVTSPGGGAQASGATVTVDWNLQGTAPTGATTTILLSNNGGQSFTPVSPQPTITASGTTGSAPIVLPTVTAGFVNAAVQVLVKDSSGNFISSGTSETFPILPTAAATAITVTAQTSPVNLPEPVPVAWTKLTTTPPAAAPASYAVLMSVDGGKTFAPVTTNPQVIDASVATASIVNLPLPNQPITTAMIQVQAFDSSFNLLGAGNGAAFTLQATPITISAPAANASVAIPLAAPSNQVSWTAPTVAAGATIASYRIDASLDGGVTFAPASPASVPASTAPLQATLTALPATVEASTPGAIRISALDAAGNVLALGTVDVTFAPAAAGGVTPPVVPPAGSFQLAAASQGAWGNSVQVTLSPGGSSGSFNIVALDTSTGRSENWSNLTSLDPNAGSYAPNVLGSGSQLVALVPAQAGATGLVFQPPTEPVTLALANGSDASLAPGAPRWAGGELIANAFAVGNPLLPLEQIAPNTFNTLSMPAIAEYYTQNEGGFETAVNQALTFCAANEAFFIMDIPSTVSTPALMQTFATPYLSATNISGAVYYPRLVMPDPANAFRPRNVASSGTIAGVYANNDTTVGVWKAPAGTTAVLQGATPAVPVIDSDNGNLNQMGINALRTFPIYGSIVWGARTLAGANQIQSQYQYIPVRRLTDYIELSLKNSLTWAVFQPNAQPLWTNLQVAISTFLAGLYSQGALFGATPAQAYFVQVDSTTTTPTDVAQGICNVVIGIAPVEPAEFIILQFELLAGQAAS